MSITNGHQREIVRNANLDQTMTKVSKRPWVRVPVRPHTFSIPETFGGQCGSMRKLRAAKRLSRRFQHGSEQILR